MEKKTHYQTYNSKLNSRSFTLYRRKYYIDYHGIDSKNKQQKINICAKNIKSKLL